MLDAFRKGLKEAGYVEGQNVAIEYRWAEGNTIGCRHWRPIWFAAGGRDCRDRRHCLCARGKGATATIPIVFVAATIRSRLGLVASLNRPGGNVTGVSYSRTSSWWQSGWSCCASWFPRNPSRCSSTRTIPNAETTSNETQAAARAIGLQIHVLKASTDREIDAAFADLVATAADALFIGSDPFFTSRRDQLGALAARHAVPTIYQ